MKYKVTVESIPDLEDLQAESDEHYGRTDETALYASHGCISITARTLHHALAWVLESCDFTMCNGGLEHVLASLVATLMEDRRNKVRDDEDDIDGLARTLKRAAINLDVQLRNQNIRLKRERGENTEV